jgi:hypothetical protein
MPESRSTASQVDTGPPGLDQVPGWDRHDANRAPESSTAATRISA